MMRLGPTLLLGVLLLAIVSIGAASREQGDTPDRETTPNRPAGLAAWQKIYSVMSHPR